MARWGLRWLFCWLSVLVTACAQLATPTPAEKTQNRTPLQGFTPPPTASPTEPFRPAYTLTPLGDVAATQTLAENPVDLIDLDMPVCYETLAQSLTCLGWVQNTGAIPLTDVFIDVSLLSPQGHPLSSTEVIPAFLVLLPGTGSPYRAIFERLPGPEWGPYAQVRQAVPQPDYGEASHQVRLETRVEDVQKYDLAYQVCGVVINDHQELVTQIRVIVIIRSTDGILLGFRLVDIGGILDEGGALPFEVEIASFGEQTHGQVLVMAQGSILRRP
ncbi:MAG: hypothetical protein GYB66_08105 [Chloroflexi bacterium]|nr:hypothetical protein [Chloroflexota bacterium]